MTSPVLKVSTVSAMGPTADVVTCGSCCNVCVYVATCCIASGIVVNLVYANRVYDDYSGGDTTDEAVEVGASVDYTYESRECDYRGRDEDEDEYEYGYGYDYGYEGEYEYYDGYGYLYEGVFASLTTCSVTLYIA